MALNASGPISLAGTTAGQSIQIENGGNGSTQISLNDAAVRSLAGVPSGAIIMPTNFYEKANEFLFNILSGTDLNLRTLALAAGWNGSSKLIATIPSGNTISASSTGVYAFTINGSFPAGVTLNNSGIIVGRGGNGGKGQPSGINGLTGGPALLVSVAVSINNINRIGGGGGGGGGGGYVQLGKTVYAGGGGGGGGIGVSLGGVGGTTTYSGSAGTAGTLIANGVGGGGGTGSGGVGGSGGGYGATGATGTTGSGVSYPAGPTAGGTGGNCLSGNANVTWIAFGTRDGAIV